MGLSITNRVGNVDKLWTTNLPGLLAYVVTNKCYPTGDVFLDRTLMPWLGSATSTWLTHKVNAHVRLPPVEAICL